MRFKYKIPPFVFGVSIGLLAGIAFFIFKIDDYLKKFNKPNIDNIKIVEQVVPAPSLEKKEIARSEKKITINTNNSPNINYNEVDDLLKEEDINVAQEELLSVKNIKVIDLDGPSKKDTLTGQLAGVTSSDYPNLFFVEFWKTPLNSKGYRMTRNRVILYGLSDFSSITIYKVDDNFYLKNDDVVYKISSGTEFKPMELVHDTDLLAKIN
ncbi:MAG: hypothetical protein K0S53_3379 [Bacteroidetes bacterium]|jgi:hypothetical protein|nr:hypothetical protein [Bacteroidota bacterium]MDF2452528.1 hypothetical protein [Bacteroidota bacterium]